MGGVQGESGGSGEEEEEEEEGGQADRSGHLVLRSGVSLSLGGEKRATLYSRELTRATLAGNFHRSRAPLPTIFFSPLFFFFLPPRFRIRTYHGAPVFADCSPGVFSFFSPVNKFSSGPSRVILSSRK